MKKRSEFFFSRAIAGVVLILLGSLNCFAEGIPMPTQWLQCTSDRDCDATLGGCGDTWIIANKKHLAEVQDTYMIHGFCRSYWEEGSKPFASCVAHRCVDPGTACKTDNDCSSKSAVFNINSGCIHGRCDLIHNAGDKT